MAKKTDGALAEKPARKTTPSRVIGEAPAKTRPVRISIRARGEQGLRIVVWGEYDSVLDAVVNAVDPDGAEKN